MTEVPETNANVEGEAALLGALMSERSIIDAIADKVQVEDFSELLFGRIYSVILREHALGRAANPVTLRPYFADDEGMLSVGGPGYLARLTGSGASIIGAYAQADQIAMLARRRRLVEGLKAALALAEDHEQTPEMIVDAADAALMLATQQGETVHQPSAGGCIDEVIAQFGQDQAGVRCGVIPALDTLLGPLRPKQLVIGAGRPGMGKTALALSYATGAAQDGHGVLFVSLEMSSTELGERMAADLCFDGDGRGVPFAAISENRATTEQKRQIVRAAEEAAALPFRVIDVGRLTIGRLNMMVRRHARRMAAQGQKLDLVVIDYLQLLSPDGKQKSPYEAVSEVSRGLKAIAKDHGVAVLALAQLSREVEKRPDKRPQLSDLRDSGQIEQDADAVLFLLREEYYVRQIEPDESDPKYVDWKEALERSAGKIEFIVAKRRNGCTGKAMGNFYTAYQAVR